MSCDRCGRRCGPFTGCDVHVSLGKRWCERCWQKVGHRRTRQKGPKFYGARLLMAALALFVLAACQTPKAQGWQDTPTTAERNRIVVIVVNLGGAVTLDHAASLDLSGSVGGGTTDTKQKQETKVDGKMTGLPGG